ncbi:hypothetical protein J7E70_23450 [Variovorax paradoxus]|nr:hypothetical protein [Variovorax paradoxus]MBT2303410.1 hypothetical protein [Variovorax paradoxus]
MRMVPPVRIPTLAQRAMELRALNFPDARVRLSQGRELRFDFSIAPTVFSRLYRCKLLLTPMRSPVMFVVKPDLCSLADGRPLPHVYHHHGPGTCLCLWLPRKNEWQSQMRLLETYLAWTGEWLNYFEEWLATDEWAGGGEHPPLPKTRRRAATRAVNP